MDKELLKIFDKLCYSKQATDVFSDLLSVTIAQFCPPPFYKDEHAAAVARLGKKELINEFIYTLIKGYQAGIECEGWCDPWGDLYMEISGQYKARGMGQFFTPVHLCDMTVKLQHQGDQRMGLLVNDPACGSGRFLLAFHANFPGNYMFAEDLDPVCCKMTVVNFAFHGCIGEIIQHDTLRDPKGLDQGWKVASVGYPVSAVLPLVKEQSYICAGVNWFDPYANVRALLNAAPAAAEPAEIPVDITTEEPECQMVYDYRAESVEQMELSLF